jgi:cyclophilin family peptidyl-prolyl cis-trans isomerase
VTTAGKGLFVFRIEFEKTPMTAASFVGLAEGTIENAPSPLGRRIFDGAGLAPCPFPAMSSSAASRRRKAEGPGYDSPMRSPGIDHERWDGQHGQRGPHTNSSQWCVMLGDRSYLDGDYTIWGEVIEGLDVVQAIVQGDAIETVKIVRVGKAAKAFRPTTESFKTMVDEAWARVKKEDADRAAAEEAAVAAGWPQAAAGENGLRYVILKEGGERRSRDGGACGREGGEG